MKCSICKKEHVKLWRPSQDTEPLICATCAEERQTPLGVYPEYNWKWVEQYNGYIGTPTGKNLPLPEWIVDDKGEIPSSHGFGPDGKPLQPTKQLILWIEAKHIFVVPAIKSIQGDYFDYPFVPKELLEWWEKLPTR